MNQTLKTILFFMMIFSGLTLEFQRLDEACPGSFSTPMKYLPEDQREISFDFKKSIKTGQFLGQGTYGKVYKVDFPAVKQGTAAMKVIKTSEVELLELSILHEMGRKGYAPAFYGCKFDRQQTYLATQLLYKDLDFKPVKDQIRGKKIWKKLEMYRDIFKGLKQLWDLGYVHNDLKPMNMMTDTNVSKIYLIDFGLSQNKREKRQSWMGTPVYRSPNFTLDPKGKLYQKDDMYSAALSIAEIESEQGYDAIWNDFSSGYRKSISTDCYKVLLSSSCRKPLFENSVKILASHGFGKYSNHPEQQTPETINLTTLLGNMILFTDFAFDYQTVIQTFDRLILEAKSPQKEEGAVAITDQDQVMMKIKQQGKMAKEKNAELASLVMAKVDKQKDAKQGELYATLHQFDAKKQESLVYKENKNLFKVGKKDLPSVPPKKIGKKDFDYSDLTDSEIKRLANLDNKALNEISSVVAYVIEKNRKKKEESKKGKEKNPDIKLKNDQQKLEVAKNLPKLGEHYHDRGQPNVDNKKKQLELPILNQKKPQNANLISHDLVHQRQPLVPLRPRLDPNYGLGRQNLYQPVLSKPNLPKDDVYRYKQDNIIAKIKEDLEKSDLLDKQLGIGKYKRQLLSKPEQANQLKKESLLDGHDFDLKQNMINVSNLEYAQMKDRKLNQVDPVNTACKSSNFVSDKQYLI